MFDFVGFFLVVGGDELMVNVFGNGGGVIEGEENRCFELGFGVFGFSLVDVGVEMYLFVNGEVDEIVDVVGFVGNEEDILEIYRKLV